MVSKVCGDGQTLAFQGPAGQCPVPVAMHYWEHSLQLLFYKISLKVRHHGSRRTLGPGPSRFGVQTGDLLPLS